MSSQQGVRISHKALFYIAFFSHLGKFLRNDRFHLFELLTHICRGVLHMHSSQISNIASMKTQKTTGDSYFTTEHVDNIAA